MIAQLPAHHEPIEGAALRRALDVILARPVVELPTPDETQILEQRKASGRIAAQNATRKYQERKAAKRPAFDRRAVAADLEAGMSIVDVTIKHQISDTTAKAVRQEWGITVRPPPKSGYDRAQALRDLASGMLAPQVADRHGVHVATIRALRRRQREGRE